MKKRRIIVMSIMSIFLFSMDSKCYAEEVIPATTVNTDVEETQNERITDTETEDPYIHLAFGGDVNFDENWSTMHYLTKQKNGILDCLSPNLIEEMKAADICMVNNEFTYSNRGRKTPGKMYTFRALPERVNYLKELGVDTVLLANNHVYDYGEDSFIDTLSTLDEAEIDHVGAGKNILDAMSPVYYQIGDVTLAYVAATRAEKYRLTPGAGENSSGVFLCYDYQDYLQVISLAKETADIVIASVHWGTETSNYAEQYQKDMAHAFIDAGADAVIGSHPHVLQGIEYYQGKPIMYSLGNFWFNGVNMYTCLFELEYDKKTAELTNVQFIPCTQYNCYTNWPQDFTMQRKIYDFEQSLCFGGVTIDDNGNVIAPAISN